MSTELEFTDRYTGMERPDPDTVCKGECEGTGRVPIFRGVNLQPKPGEAIPGDEGDPVFVALWNQAEAKQPSEGGWHFVVCPACDGTVTRKDGR